MLGTALLPVLKQRHPVSGIDRQDCDICNPLAIAALIHDRRPHLVIHLAAYTNVDGAEDNPQLAEEVNAAGTRNIAAACAAIDAAMLYVSTDYVFDGSKQGAYREDDSPHPLNAYGKSKWMGEQHVSSLLNRHFIVRTSWLYGPNGKNFVTSILKAAQQQSVLRVVNDQRGSPTYTRHLSATIAALIETERYGTYHATGCGSCTWFEFAQAILELWPVKEVQVLPISSKDSGRTARRPMNSVLENWALKRIGLKLMPDWKAALGEYLQEISRARAIQERMSP
jgi:dTDP-4-dehydrorhamnose reductase